MNIRHLTAGATRLQQGSWTVVLLLTIQAVAAAGSEYRAGDAVYSVNPETGAVTAIERSGRRLSDGIENQYYVRRASGDAKAFERDDKRRGSTTGGMTLYENPKLPGLEIWKSLCAEGRYLRRTIRFRNNGRDTAFVTMRTRTRFTPDFYKDGFYLGSGYIGPLIPVPKLSAPRMVTEYRQSTKGMLLYHDWGKTGSFAHYRLKLNGSFVFPWWQSAITNYVEEENHLFYHPDGWEMSLGTVDMHPGESFEITDCFTSFTGGWYEFMDDVYPGDPVVKPELEKFRPGPAWLDEVCAVSDPVISSVRQIAEALENGRIMVLTGFLGDWGDYRVWQREFYPGESGGGISITELRAGLDRLRSLSPRVMVGCYMFMNSAMLTSPIVAEHPEYFLLRDRTGRPKNLFPGGFVHNYPTMVNRPETSDYLIGVFRKFIETMRVDFIYLDETKTTNLIDWSRGDCVRDDHWYAFWKRMHDLGQEKSVVMFGNARGNPNHELNYIEAAGQLNPRYWRQFAGMAMATAAFAKHRAGARLCLLYWWDNVDYIDRVLANGFIPALTPYRPRQLPFVRAAAENGPLTVVPLKYAPDWKNDSATGLESYAAERRNGKETLLSIIRREEKTSPEVEIDLSSQPDNLSIWCYRIADYKARLKDNYFSSDNDLRRVYRANGWREDIIAEPELLYSGKNPGTFHAKAAGLGLDRMAILVLGHPLAGVFSVGGLPKNFFYSVTPEVVINGTELPLQVDCKADGAEIILFTPGRVFRVNGNPAAIKYAEFGGRYFPIVAVPRGKSTVSDAGPALPPSGLVSVRRDNILRYCGMDFRLPEFQAGGKLTLTSQGRPTVVQESRRGTPTQIMRIPPPSNIPGENTRRTVHAELDGAMFAEAATWTLPRLDRYGLQPELPPLTAVADPQKLSLRAGTTRRVEDFSGHAAAGFRITGAERLDFALEHTFDLNSGINLGNVPPSRRNPGEFAGLMVDYRTVSGWQRTAFAFGGILNPNPAPGEHPWGAQKTSSRIMLGPVDWLDKPGKQNFTLSLRRYAPKDWTGEVWVTAATGFVGPGRTLEFSIRATNAACRSGELLFRDRAEELRRMSEPRKLAIPKLTGPPDFSQVWSKGAGTDGFTLLHRKGRPRHDTEFRVAHDGRNIYAAVRIAPDPKGNNSFEVWLQAPGDSRCRQIIAKSYGAVNCYIGGEPDAGSGVSVRCSQNGQELLFTIPASWCGSALNGKWRLNICRTRDAVSDLDEDSSWSVLNMKFAEPENFGTVTFE